MALATGLGGVFNFLFNLIVSNRIPEQFGEVYPLTSSLFLFISLPAMAFQYAITDEFSGILHQANLPKLKSVFRDVLKFVLIYDVLISVILIALIPLLQNMLHIHAVFPFLIIISAGFLASFQAPFYSMIQSRERFLQTGIAQILSIVLKFGVGISLVVWTSNYFGVLWGVFAGSSSLFLILLFDFLRFKDFRSAQSTDESHFNRKAFWKTLFYALISYGSLQLINYSDTLFVRHFLETQSDLYSAVNVLGKASYFLATAFAFVLLPFMSKEKENIQKRNREGLILLSVFLVAYAGVLLVFGKFISGFLFQGNYPGMENLLGIYGVVFLPYAMMTYLVNYYFVSKNKLYAFTLLGGVVLQFIGFYFFHESLRQVALVVGIIGYSLLGLLIVDSALLKKKRSNRKSS